MTRKRPTSTVDRSLAIKYFDKAVQFKTDAEKMLDLANEFSNNGVAVLCVHSAIAYGDAVAILAAGCKSKSSDHREAAPFLASLVPIRSVEDKSAIRAFQVILNRKDDVSYLDELVDDAEAKALLGKLKAFARWAEKTFQALRRGTHS
jgi:hypothetical protein